MKLLFFGDGITDAGRDRSDYHNLGNCYPKYAADGVHPTPKGAEFIGKLCADYVQKLLDSTEE